MRSPLAHHLHYDVDPLDRFTSYDDTAGFGRSLLHHMDKAFIMLMVTLFGQTLAQGRLHTMAAGGRREH